MIKVGIYEYNEELHIQQERSDAKEEGRGEGIWLFSLRLIRKKWKKDCHLNRPPICWK